MTSVAPPRQNSSPAWAKPFAAAWRARAYFLISLIFWVLPEVVPSSVFSSPGSVWWQNLLSKALGSFDKISEIIFLAGLIYAVLSDAFDYVWNTNFQSEVKAGFLAISSAVDRNLDKVSTGLANISFEAVKVWIEGGSGSSDQLRTLGVSSLRGYYGKDFRSKDNFLDFIVDDITDHSAFKHSQTWSYQTTNITIQDCQIPNHFEWIEHKSYEIVCMDLAAVIPIQIEISARIDKEHLDNAISGLKYTFDFGGVRQFSFEDWWKKHQSKKNDDNFIINEDNAGLSYDGNWLILKLSRNCAMKGNRTQVTIYEKSYISQHDRCFVLALRHPTEVLRTTLTINVQGWSVKTPVVSAKLYKRGEEIVATGAPQSHTCTTHVQGWTLPGVAMVIEWTPT